MESQRSTRRHLTCSTSRCFRLRRASSQCPLPPNVCSFYFGKIRLATLYIDSAVVKGQTLAWLGLRARRIETRCSASPGSLLANSPRCCTDCIFQSSRVSRIPDSQSLPKRGRIFSATTRPATLAPALGNGSGSAKLYLQAPCFFFSEQRIVNCPVWVRKI